MTELFSKTTLFLQSRTQHTASLPICGTCSSGTLQFNISVLWSVCINKTAVYLLLNIFQYKCSLCACFPWSRTHMQNIKDITSSIHYEMYRVRRLNENNTQTNGQQAIHTNGIPEPEVLSHEM